MKTTDTKLCPRCSSVKPIGEFNLNKKTNKRAYACKSCMSSTTQQWQQKLFESTDPNDILKATFYKMLQSSRSNAKSKNIPYTLNLQSLTELYNKQHGKCYYTGVLMGLRGSEHVNRDPLLISLDRLDPQQGYIQSNVVLCCWGINALKGWITEEMLYALIRLFYEGAAAKGKYNTTLTSIST